MCYLEIGIIWFLSITLYGKILNRKKNFLFLSVNVSRFPRPFQLPDSYISLLQNWLKIFQIILCNKLEVYLINYKNKAVVQQTKFTSKHIYFFFKLAIYNSKAHIQRDLHCQSMQASRISLELVLSCIQLTMPTHMLWNKPGSLNNWNKTNSPLNESLLFYNYQNSKGALWN